MTSQEYLKTDFEQETYWTKSLFGGAVLRKSGSGDPMPRCPACAFFHESKAVAQKCVDKSARMFKGIGR